MYFCGKNTQKSKFLLSQAFKWKKIMFFVIPAMPSKTFVVVKKKLPDHVKAESNNFFYPAKKPGSGSTTLLSL